MKYLEKPDNLSELGEKAYNAILQFLQEHEITETGGCKAFYSPTEWKEKGETYGLGSELVVCHDGGDHALAFCHEKEAYSIMELMSKALEPLGLYSEQCTGWYSAIYKI